MKPTLSREKIGRLATFAKPQSASPKNPARVPVTDRERAEMIRLRNQGMALQDIAEATGRHLNTAWKIVSAATARGQCIGGRMRRAKP
jgi:hypothetical protein